MTKIPATLENYARQSPYGPFADFEIARLAQRLARGYVDASDESIELDLLGHRAEIEPTDRNVAIYNNAVHARRKASGMRSISVLCECGSSDAHWDADGPNPKQRVCDECGAPLSEEHIQRATTAARKRLWKDP